MIGRKGRRVQFLPTVVDDLDPVFRLPIAMRLLLIDEAVCGPQASRGRRTRRGKRLLKVFSGPWGGIGRLMRRPLWTT